MGAQVAWAAGSPHAAAATTAPPRTLLKVGPGRDFATLSTAAKAVAGQGPTHIVIDAGGYSADVAVWENCDVVIEPTAGRVALRADGAAAEAKAIWVLRGCRMHVRDVDFSGCRVPDRNGAGIRLESESELHVSGCRFRDNENGILTGNDGKSRLVVDRTEFGGNGAGDGQSHNLYVGAIAHFSMTACYSHHAQVGHLVKSRAAESFIRYNRLTDETSGRASYELDLPSGGIAVVVGNIIQQGPNTENPHLLSFGVEGLKWPRNELYMAHNTLVDRRRSGGLPLNLRRADEPLVRVSAYNNLLSGFASVPLSIGPFTEDTGNYRAIDSDFISEGDGAWRLKQRSSSRFKPRPLSSLSTDGLVPTYEYRHPMQLSPLPGGIRTVGAHP